MTDLAIAPIDVAYEYAQFIEDLRHALDIKESAQWLIGDFIKDKATHYAEKTMEMIADDIGVSAKSLYSWRNLSIFYPEDVRTHYKSHGLYYSHLRTAYALGNLPDAREFLDECILRAFTVYGAQMALKEIKGQTVKPTALFNDTATFERVNGAWVIRGIDYTEIQDGHSYAVTIRRLS